MLEFEVGSTR